MTWNSKVGRVVLVGGLLGAMALASGANFIEWLSWLWW
jgi:hypothetical protein